MTEPPRAEDPAERTGGSSPSTRRRFLRACGLAAAGILVVGGAMRNGYTDESTPGSADPCVDCYTVADLSPGEEVSGIVGDIGANEHVVFPSGRYSWSEAVHVTADDWGIWCQDDTVFEVPDGMGDDEEAELLGTRLGDQTADRFHLEGLTFDSAGRSAPGLHLGVRNHATVNGVEYRMNGPLTDQRQENGIRAYVESPDGELRIDDYRQFNNGNLGGTGNGDGRIGIWVGPENAGTVRLRNPVLQGFPNNACYVSSQPGRVVIDGGFLANNNVSAVRVSGGVEVRGTTIYIDVDRFVRGDGRIDGEEHNTRGLWGDNRGGGKDGGLATDVSLVVRSYRHSSGLATIVENPRMTIRDCQFFLGADIEAIQAAQERIVVRNCRFDGNSSGAIAGTGTIDGSGNSVTPTVAAGTVPDVSRTGYEFDWSATHRETPNRDGS